MPFASLYTTKEMQHKLMYGIQDVIVRSFETLHKNNSLIRNITALYRLTQVARRIRKLPRPEHNNVNTHNQHVIIDMRDDFMAHDDPQGSRPMVYEAIFNLAIVLYGAFLDLIAIKYGFDGHMGRRFDYIFKQWKESDWIFPGKHPETDWILNEEDKQEPTYIRQQRLKEALHNREFAKALNLIG